jgi:sigma-B regulation protein RsbU (phosphoserine phosphatase)
VGDVSDKGAPAALFMARAMGLIQQLAVNASDPAAAMGALNNALEQGNDNCMFITLFLGVLDLQSQELRFASAGHTAPSLLRSGAAHAIAQQQGPALGLAAGLEYPGNSLALRYGDRLAIFTDGIDEAFNDSNEMYGAGRFNSELVACADKPVAAAGPRLLAAIDRFAADRPQSDDITLMLLDIKAAASAATHALIDLHREFLLTPGITGEVHSWLQQVLAQLAAAPRQDLLLVVEEVVSNIAKYADLPPRASISLAVTADPGQVAVEVRDAGIAFDPLSEARRAELGELTENASVGGLGVHLVTALTDKQSYRREGGCNILGLVKFL